MERLSSLKIKKVGLAVVEVVEIKMQLNEEDRKMFRHNPEEVMKRLLEKSGQTVNRLILSKDFIKRHSENPIGEETPHQYHIVYPEEERSGWVCA